MFYMGLGCLVCNMVEGTTMKNVEFAWQKSILPIFVISIMFYYACNEYVKNYSYIFLPWVYILIAVGNDKFFDIICMIL